MHEGPGGGGGGGGGGRGEKIHPYNDLVLVQWNLLIMDTLGTPDYCPL